MSKLSNALKINWVRTLAEKALGYVFKKIEPVKEGEQPTYEAVSKSVLASKSVWGGIIAAAPSILGAFGIPVLGGEIDAIIAGAGVVIAIFGRIKAKVSVK